MSPGKCKHGRHPDFCHQCSKEEYLAALYAERNGGEVMDYFNATITRKGRETKPSQLIGYKWADLMEALVNYQSSVANPLIRVEIIREDATTEEKPPDPTCEECNEPMHRYGPAPDTGKMGWSCDSCGWSWDD